MNFDGYRCKADGLPSLWPYAPTWVGDAAMKKKIINLLGPAGQAAEMMAAPYVKQRQMDYRWRLYNQIAEGMKDEALSLEDWEERTTKAAGWSLKAEVAAQVKALGEIKSCSSAAWNKLMMNALQTGGLELAEDYVSEIALEGKCDECGKPCTSECMCGEMYCSRDCLGDAWEKGHRGQCEAIFENHTLAMMMNQLEFDKFTEGLDRTFTYGGVTGFQPFLNDQAAAASQRGQTVPNGRAAVPKRTGPKVKPNDSCPCASGKKYKKCCGAM